MLISTIVVFWISHVGSASLLGLDKATDLTHPKGGNGGEWNVCTHLSIYGTNVDPRYDKALVRLMRQIRGKTSLEFGSGTLLYSSFLAKLTPWARDIVGIEPIPSNYKQEMGVVSPNGFPRQAGINILSCTAQELHEQRLDREFDLVHSNEVLEHISMKAHPGVFDFLVARTSKLLVFGMARKGQHGTGHIACQDPPYVLHNFKKRGLRYLPNITQAMHKLGGWMPENRLVFTKDPNFKDMPSLGLLALARPAGYQFDMKAWEKERHEFAKTHWPKLQNLVDLMKVNQAECNPNLIG